MSGREDEASRAATALLLAALDGDNERMAQLIGGLDLGATADVISLLAASFAHAIVAGTGPAGTAAARRELAGHALRLAAS